MVFSAIIRFCSRHSSLISGMLHHSKRKPLSAAVSPHPLASPQPLATPDLPVSVELPVVDVSGERSH